jgi:hypothetical protein
MDIESSPDATVLSLRGKAQSLYLILSIAMVTGALRVATEAAKWITLWHSYGWARVEHDHLRVVGIRPLVVSNGDVSREMSDYCFSVGLAIWLVSLFGLMYAVNHKLLPPQFQLILREKAATSMGLRIAVRICALSVAILVGGFLPLTEALMLSFVTAAGALIWLRKILYANRSFG